jgi:SAM-dependent methyltransferase
VRNRDQWVSSKFEYRRGKLVASRDRTRVGLGSRLMVDLIAACYDAHIKEYVRGRLIDLGCGEVPLFAAYRDYVTDNVCVDWANTPHKSEYLDFECDLTENLPFKDEEFDTIILSDVLEHIAQPERLWSEMSRILAHRGRILMNVPFYYWIHEGPHDYYRYTEFALRRFVASSGLKLLLLKPLGGAPEILADILAKNVLRFRGGKTLATLIQELAAAVGRSSLGTRLSDETSKKFPFGYFLVAEKSK